MKNIFSTLSLILLVGLLSVNAQCCKTATNNCDTEKELNIQAQEKSDVQVYYFHATRRCATCQAVETVSKETMKEYYGDKVDFTSLNREKKENKDLIVKYKISGQTLLVVKGDKVINLTNYAFMNARTNPDKLKAKIKATIDPII